MENGYPFTRDDFPTLMRMPRYPEQTARQSALIRAYFAQHLQEFDRVVFERRVGEGLTPDPTHHPGVQAQTLDVTRQRIDLLAWAGQRPTIHEFKDRVTNVCLGQILSYRVLLLKEFPDAPDPALVVVGRRSDPDTIVPLNAHGITVYLYETADAGGDAVPGGV